MQKSQGQETFNPAVFLLLIGAVIVGGVFIVSIFEKQVASASTNADIQILNAELRSTKGRTALTLSVKNSGTVDIASMEVEIPELGVYEQWMLRRGELFEGYDLDSLRTSSGNLIGMNDKLYFAVRQASTGGGLGENLFLFMYDPMTNSWTEKTRFGPSVIENKDVFYFYTRDFAVLDNKLYVSLMSSSDNLFVYDPAIDSWSEWVRYPQNPNNPSSLLRGYGSVLVECDGKLYYSKGEASKLWFKYNPDPGEWIRLENFPGKYGTYECPTVATNGKIYIGGQFHDPENFYVYDTSTDSWSQIPDCPGNGLKNKGATALENKLYVGPDENNNWWMYDPATDEWTEKLSYAGSKGSGGGSKVASAGGSAYVTYQVSKEFQEYTPVASLPGVEPGENVSKNIDIHGYGFVTEGPYTVWITAYDSDRNPIVEKEIKVKME